MGWVSGIRDPGSRFGSRERDPGSEIWVPDPGVKKHQIRIRITLVERFGLDPDSAKCLDLDLVSLNQDPDPETLTVAISTIQFDALNN